MKFRHLFIALGASFLLTACPKPECEFGEVRCNGELLEYCDSARQWAFQADCERVSDQSSGTWQCLEEPEPACVRVSEDEE